MFIQINTYTHLVDLYQVAEDRWVERGTEQVVVGTEEAPTW